MASKISPVGILLLTVASAWPCGVLGAQSPPRLDDPSIEQRVSQLVENITGAAETNL